MFAAVFPWNYLLLDPPPLENIHKIHVHIRRAQTFTVRTEMQRSSFISWRWKLLARGQAQQDWDLSSQTRGYQGVISLINCRVWALCRKPASKRQPVYPLSSSNWDAAAILHNQEIVTQKSSSPRARNPGPNKFLKNTYDSFTHSLKDKNLLCWKKSQSLITPGGLVFCNI